MYQTRRALLLCLSLFYVAIPAFATPLNCKNTQGQPVSWWVVIKLPNTLDDYLYRDSSSEACSDTTSCFGGVRHDLNDVERGPLSSTLQQIYKSIPGEAPAYLMYNDDTSLEGGSDTHSGYAHAKGVVGSSAQGGFWLVHSVPRFPREVVGSQSYAGLTKNGRNNAQSFLCISLSPEQMKIVASQLALARPFVYQKGGFNEELSKTLGDDFAKVLAGVEAKAGDLQSSTRTLVDVAGNSFTSFIKSKTWGKDLYEDLVSTELRANLFVESWTKGRGTLASSCALSECVGECPLKFDVANVTQVKAGDLAAWHNHKDHSKWAVTTPSSETHAVCIGDINRQNGQRVRGGGTVCLKDENLWKAFSGMVSDAEHCARP